MNIVKNLLKAKYSKIGVCISLVFIMNMTLFVSSQFVNRDNSRLPKEDYVKINGKVYSMEEFDSYLENKNDNDINIKASKVRSVLYVGNDDEVEQAVFASFPNVQKIAIRKCILKDIELGKDLNELKVLDFGKCTIDKLKIDSKSVRSLKIDSGDVKDIYIELPELKKLSIHNNDITGMMLSNFYDCKKMKAISIFGSNLDTIKMLEPFKDITFLQLQETHTSGFENLSLFSKLNEIYLEPEIDRSNIDFMYGNFKNGDIETRAYFVNKEHDLNERKVN